MTVFRAVLKSTILMCGLIVNEYATAAPQLAASQQTEAAFFEDLLGAQPFSYTSMKGHVYSLTPWTGKYVALLTKNKDLDPMVMKKLLDALDFAYVYYAQITGKIPTPYLTYANRLSIAEVSDTCGAGCGYLGLTGIELLESTFNKLYQDARDRNSYDQAVFYEFGRNFWFYEKQLGKIPALTTGFAISNRFYAMEYARLRGAPFKTGMTFTEFKKSVLSDLLEIYMANDRFTWRNTIAINVAPPNPNNWGGADLVASMLNVIRRDGGPGAMQTFWRTMGELPEAVTREQAINNFLAAAKAASGKDYRPLMKDFSLPSP